MLRRLLPHPLLSVFLAIFWLQLVNKITPGNILLGSFLAIVIPIMTSTYWPDRPLLKRPLKAFAYTGIVLWDILVANIQVALIVLFKPNREIRSKWISVPLELKEPEAITVLAATITLTPGTVSAMLSADGSALLVHCLHSDDPEAVCADIKSRYERRLKEIFG
ncbi:Na+/H+ antiporter subunit E [Poseidonocella sedimentorum]|uniref:Na+/H+ antiporter subunit E n=1 Tax=Poseidonocella sedimentorum TaxID=871652 RepID=UPI000B82F948|nr:Na+/H+ antiporter subunit E [Poseidonocella sedimentorum]